MACCVTVDQGILQGRVCTAYDGTKYYSFEGIPYAKPPLGHLRFKEPQEPAKWVGVRDATKPGNKCAQINPFGKKLFEGSEDCLYLNVYTPKLPADELEKLPVLFFVHGGRLLMGHGDYYQPDYFMRHNVILVTINYRLHVLGFLCLNIPEVPGNAGLKDTVMALKWVKKNIIHFNGNNENITAFGESAGAAIVSSYLTSKMATGLCHRLIAQSGNCLSDLFLAMSDDNPVKMASKIASILGQTIIDETSLYEFLSKVPIEELVFAFTQTELQKPWTALSPIFLPIVEKKFDGIERYFEEHPILSFQRNCFQKIPILTGLSSHEGGMFLRKRDDGNIEIEDNLRIFIPRYLSINRNSATASRIVNDMRKFYFNNKSPNEASTSEYLDFASDVFFNNVIMEFTEVVSKYTDSLYFYRFSYAGKMNTRVLKKMGIEGATHGDIIQYQFYKNNKAKNCTEDDKKIIDFLSETWSNFARYGKPSWTSQAVEWLPYSKNNKNYLSIDKEINTDNKMDWDRFGFWKKFGERSKL